VAKQDVKEATWKLEATVRTQYREAH